ncbi:hypothetical protein ATERTT37_006778 [Aspergillus terreus]
MPAVTSGAYAGSPLSSACGIWQTQETPAQPSQGQMVDVTKVQAQFDGLLKLKAVKRVVSFGGWSFSTDYDTFPIFRVGVSPANREAFAQSVAKFATDHNLDGLDFDWEYPGLFEEGSTAPAIRETLSIAAPASYWYLKGFPIKEISDVVDYIVYMTYDLHGQWDFNNAWANSGYISNYEIQQIIIAGDEPDLYGVTVTRYEDKGYILVYDGDQWVSYMSDDTMAARVEWYSQEHFGGRVVWAADLYMDYGNNGTGLPYDEIDSNSITVPNPKDLVTAGLNNIMDTRIKIAATWADMVVGYWNGSYIDVAQVLSVPVFMLEQAVNAMAQVKDIGK